MWLKRLRQLWHPARRQPYRIARPRAMPWLEELESRVVPDNSPYYSPCIVAPFPPNTVNANQTFNLVVECVSAGNVVVPSYTGTMVVTTAPLTLDPATPVLAQYTFTENDSGVHTFHLKLSGSGVQTVYVTDPEYLNYDYRSINVKGVSQPSISGLSSYVAPNFVNANFNGTMTVTISGQGFDPTADATFGDINASTHYVSPTQLRVNLSGFQNLPEGFRTVTVENLDDGGTVSLTGSNGFYVSALVLQPIQINQGIPLDSQTGGTAAVAEHTTVVRVQVQTNGGNIPSFYNPLAIRLRVLYTPSGGQQSQVYFLSPDPNPNPDIVPDYEVRPVGTVATPLEQYYLQDYFNFTLSPSQLPAGDYVFNVEVSATDPKTPPPTLPGDLTESLSVTFAESKPMHILALLEGDAAANEQQVNSAFNLLEASYPVSADQFVATTVVNSPYTFYSYGSPFNSAEQRTLNSLASAYDDTYQGQGYNGVILFTANTPTDFGNGLTDASSSVVRNANGTFSGTFNVVAPVTIINLNGPDIPGTVCHEVGHWNQLGDTYLSDAGGYNTLSSLNPLVPNPDASAAGNAVDQGNINTITHTASVATPIPYTNTYGHKLTTYPYLFVDYMGSGPTTKPGRKGALPTIRWTTTTDWNVLYSIFDPPTTNSNNVSPNAKANTAAIYISGEIAANGTANFEPFLTFSGTNGPTDPGLSEGPYTIEIQGSNGQVLASRTFTPIQLDQYSNGILSFDLDLPFPTGSAKVLLLNGKNVLLTQSIPAQGPTVQITSPGTGTLSGDVTINWTGSEPSGTPLTYDIYYSPDGGTTWLPIAVDLTQESYDWDTSTEPGTRDGEIEVVASDGVNQGSAVAAGPFTLATQSTTVSIIAPSDGSSVATGEDVLLQGVGFDPQTGTLPDSSLTWTDSVAGVLGTGSNLLVDLSAGTHQITLTGIDASGNQVQATETLTVSSTPGTLTGTVFNDVNNTGAYDGSEPTLAGVTVFIDTAGTGAYATGDPTAQTNADGAYSFENVPAGVNYVGIVPPNGFTSEESSVEVSPGGSAELDLAAEAQQLVISAPGQVSANGKFSVSVSAVNPDNTAYSGPITLGVSGGPTNGKLMGVSSVTAVNGVATFNNLSLNKVGSYSLFAASTSDLIGASVPIQAAAAPSFKVTLSPAQATAGAPVTLTITASEPKGTVYQGTVRLTSTDSQIAGLPTTFTFPASDNGIAIFTVTMGTAGSQSVEVADTTLPTAKGASNAVKVVAGTMDHFAVSGLPGTDVIDSTQRVTVKAVDAYGNLVKSYTGSVQLSTTGGQGIFPAAHQFVASNNGSFTFSNVALTSLGAGQSLVAGDGTYSGSETGITVVSTATQLAITGLPATVTAGQTIPITVAALSSTGSTDTAFPDTIQFSSTDPKALIVVGTNPPASLPASGTLTNGSATFNITFETAGSVKLSITDTARSSLSAQATTTVSPAQASGFRVSGFPASAEQNVASSFTVQAIDAYGNLTSNYTGTVEFTSSDSQAVLPAEYTFTKTDSGVHSFTATLNVPGTQSLTVTDAANSSITGTQSGINVQGDLAPKSLLIYYGYPSLINGASTLGQAAATLAEYDYVVLGDTLELSTHPDHANTIAILANPVMSHTTVFGYIDLGVTTQDLSIAEIESRVDDWKAMGVTGIFLDDFGYDFGVTRDRQNTIVDYIHSQGQVVAANAFDPDDAFGDQVNATDNPSGTATALTSSDFYLYESYQVSTGSIVDPATWSAKATSLAAYQASIGFKVLAVTTANSSNTYSQSEFNYAWYSALSAGYEAIGWGEYDYSSSTSQAQYRPRPSLDPGTSFIGNPVTVGAEEYRDTNLGQVQVNTDTDTGSFTANPVTKLTLGGVPASSASGQQFKITVQAMDGSQTAPTFQDTLRFTSSDPEFAPFDMPFTGTNGTETFSITLNTAGAQTITVTDLDHPNLTIVSKPIKVLLSSPIWSTSVSAPTSSGIPGTLNTAVIGQPLTFTFNASESGQPSNALFTYHIDWDGNGKNVQTVSGSNPLMLSHVFTTAGSDTVKMAATDADGNVSPTSTGSGVTVDSIALEPSVTANASTLAIGFPAGGGTLEISSVTTDSTGQSVSVSVNGVSEGSFLESAQPLANMVVYGQSGNEEIQENNGSVAIAVPLIVFGGVGNDTISVAGSSANNILVGGSGRNALTGGSGRDILIGGASGDSTLTAGSGDDVLIAGSTTYDSNLNALLSLMAEWGRTDAPFAQRVQDLAGTSAAGLNGDFLLDSATVQPDKGGSQLIGGNGQDWYWYQNAPVADSLSGLTFGEPETFRVNAVNPTVQTATPSITDLTNSQIGINTFSIAVTYSAAMDTNVAPTIEFSPDVSSVLTLASGVWDSTHTIYTANYDVANVSLNVTGVQFAVNDGESEAGVVQVPFIKSNAFSISVLASPDISVTENDTSAGINSNDFGESFVPTVSGPLTQLNILNITGLLNSQGQALSSDTATLQIYQGGINTSDPSSPDYDTPAGPLLYSQNFTITTGNISIPLTNPPQLVAGQPYLWKVVCTNVAWIDANIATNNPYPQGDTLAGPGFGYDLDFQTYM